MLTDKIAYYNETGKSLTVTPAKYKHMEKYAYLKDVNSLALANVQLDLQDAYKAFFDRVKKGKNRNSRSSRARKNALGFTADSLGQIKTAIIMKNAPEIISTA